MPSSGPFESRTYPIAEDMAVQQTTWRVQRIAWAGLALVCIASALGAFGDGMLARATAADPTGRLRIDYGRIERRDAVGLMRIRLEGLPAGGEAVVRYDRAFVDRHSLRDVTPAPLRTSGDATALLHAYAVPASGELEVLIEYRPRASGTSRARVGLVGGPDVVLDQLVLP